MKLDCYTSSGPRAGCSTILKPVWANQEDLGYCVRWGDHVCLVMSILCVYWWVHWLACLSWTFVLMSAVCWSQYNTIAKVLNHISLEWAGHQQSDTVGGVCIPSLEVELWVKMCNKGEILCEYYHILVSIFLNISIPHTLLECWWLAIYTILERATLHHCHA